MPTLTVPSYKMCSAQPPLRFVDNDGLIDVDATAIAIGTTANATANANVGTLGSWGIDQNAIRYSCSGCIGQ
jgi:hypothetical protein